MALASSPLLPSRLPPSHIPNAIGVVGLGIMGSAIASHLIDAGHAVVGFDVRANRRRALRKTGVIAAVTCRDVGQQASIVITSLPSADALMLTVAELGKAPRRPRIVIETSTLPIEVKERARSRLDACGVVLLDCPISGTGAQARACLLYTSPSPRDS